jgi:hypothetical protein
MAAKKENNWIPWAIIAGLVLYAASQQPKGGGDPSTAAAVSAAKQTIPNIRAAYREAFLDAAGTVADRQAIARLAASEARFERDIAKAKLERIKLKVRVLDTNI